MTVVRNLWASIQGDPVFMRRVNGWLTILWIVMIPISIVTHWVTSVVYVSALSLWALVSGHWSAWQAARVEVAQQEEAKRHEQEDIPRDVVAELVRTTTIEPEGPDAAFSSSGPGGFAPRPVDSATPDRG
ncbi:MAG: hypothetical protein M0Z98_08120 [Actinomycetales bacterium]|nr:hypothetical protein [Actinomycetales bacterium]